MAAALGAKLGGPSGGQLAVSMPLAGLTFTTISPNKRKASAAIQDLCVRAVNMAARTSGPWRPHKESPGSRAGSLCTRNVQTTKAACEQALLEFLRYRNAQKTRAEVPYERHE